MAEVMGMGTNSWRNYEGGEIPSKVHANLIHLVSDPAFFERHILENSELDEKGKEKILARVKDLIKPSCHCSDLYGRFRSSTDVTTGFRPFSEERLKHVVLFFAEKLKPYKTKLNKLLFYADFVNFRETAQSITGLKYKAIPFGPVPVSYDYLFEALESDFVIEKEWMMTEVGQMEKIVPANESKFDKNLFSDIELESLEYVAKRFKRYTAKEIADCSHEERAWKDNITGNKLIPFNYAFSLETA
jgi:uncharacterized phage-associated protein